MTSAFVKQAVTDLIAKAEGLGVPVPDEVRRLTYCGASNGGAILYARAHPDEDDPTVPDELRWCCYGATSRLDSCTCWEPIWNREQQPPQLPVQLTDLQPRDWLCGDCAFRKDSPERSSEYEEETLLGLAERGQPFWCHDGMRRPLEWRHPHGLTIAGDPADWQPPIVHAIPFRADGTPGLLCAGWAARAARASQVHT
jgi:hypothetical protein